MGNPGLKDKYKSLTNKIFKDHLVVNIWSGKLFDNKWSLKQKSFKMKACLNNVKNKKQLNNIFYFLQILVLVLVLLSYAMAASVLVPLTSVVRTPEDDTAVVESSRIKGNFAYSTVEGHAYKAITPVLGHIVAPDYLQPFNYVYVQH